MGRKIQIVEQEDEGAPMQSAWNQVAGRSAALGEVVALLRRTAGDYFASGKDDRAACVRELLTQVEKAHKEATASLDGFIQRDLDRRQRKA